MKAEKTISKGLNKDIAPDEKPIFNTATPLVTTEFLGNPNNGSSPMDNSIAISNDDLVVSVANTTIQYKTNTGALLFASSLVDFVGDPGISNICDPLIHYDPVADRFIFFAQECSGNSSNSFLLILFSQTNNPEDGWNYYKLTGNPLSDGSWFDYPKMGISQNELFITGNLFFDGGGFNESIIYQMEKFDGYAGDPLTWQYWSGIEGSPFTIMPVSSGNELNYGPGIYCVATSPFSGNSIRFYDITDDIAGSPSLDYYSVSTPFYEAAGNAFQSGTSCRLNTGDSRALSGFYLNGIVHFVHHSDIGGGWSGINYNRLDVGTLTNQSILYGDEGANDYAFPSVAWFGSTPTDKSVVIGFGAVNSTIFPEMRVIACDDGGEWSTTTLVQESFDYVSFTSPTVERWGDYTGIHRLHDAVVPTAWMSGMYGTLSNRWNTWIAEIIGVDATGIVENNINEADMLIAPNPVVESFVLKFTAAETMAVQINVVGIDGKLVKSLYTGTAYEGLNDFSFNTSNLATGTYFLQVKSADKIVANEKIIIR